MGHRGTPLYRPPWYLDEPPATFHLPHIQISSGATIPTEIELPVCGRRTRPRCSARRGQHVLYSVSKMASNEAEEELERLRRQLAQVEVERTRLMKRVRDLARKMEADGREKSAACQDSMPETELALGSRELSEVVPRVNDSSPLAAKVKLLRSLFHGREDVFARLWVSTKDGRAGYSPVCKHEWDPGICGKPNVKCSNCPNRNFAPLTDGVIQRHLEGKLTIGIYPMLPDETCRFLAIDFDKQSWTEDTAAFLETCSLMGVPAALERSRSGHGGHVWVFFTGPVSATKARQLGCCLLTETMSRHYRLGMDSYDRLFPNQDTLPKGGLGNLIALPLQKTPSAKGNSVFVNDSLEAYRDQWAFLASLGRLKPSTVESLAREAARRGQIIGVGIDSAGEDDRPWNLPPSRRTPEPSLTGLWPESVKVVFSNLLYIEKEGLSSPVLNRIKRLAAFQNPEFYKRQSLRLSTALTPRVISCSQEFPKHLGLPRGCHDGLQELLTSNGARLDLMDDRSPGKELSLVFQGQLSPVQQAAAMDLLHHDNGVFVAPAGLGKTAVGAYLIAARGRNALVLVHRRQLLEQWQAQLSGFFGLDPKTIGQIGAGKDKRSGLIDVAMLQSLIHKGEVKDLVADYGHVLVDECHHVPAVTFEQVLGQVKARYVTGLTATPYRRDGHHPIITMQCGPIRHAIDPKDQAARHPFSHRLICRDTGFRPPDPNVTSIQELYTALSADEARNRQILNDVVAALEEGRWPILLSERRQHLTFFTEQLSKAGHKAIVLWGGMGARQRRAAKEQLSADCHEKGRVVLATGRYAGEGFDDARLDTLFLALPVSWKGVLTQYAGRLHRTRAGKTEVRIYDYVDQASPLCMRMFQRRLRGYRALGYEPDVVTGAGDGRLNGDGGNIGRTHVDSQMPLI